MNNEFEKKHEEMLEILENTKENFSDEESLELINLINEYDRTIEVEDAIKIQNEIIKKCRNKTTG